MGVISLEQEYTMKVQHSLMVAVLGSLLTALFFTGCSGGGSPLASGNNSTAKTGTVRLLMTDSANRAKRTGLSTATTATLPLLFNQIQLITGLDANSSYLSSSATIASGALPGQLISLVNTPIPYLSGSATVSSGSLTSQLATLISVPTLVSLLENGNTGTPVVTSAVSQQVSTGLYTELRLVLDQASASTAGSNGLPFNSSQLTSLIPISGGAQVNTGATVLLLVDLAKQQAQVISPSSLTQMTNGLTGVNLPINLP